MPSDHTPEALNEAYALPGILHFAPAAGALTAAHITLPTGAATVYLHGAHLTSWQPTGLPDVFFLSSLSPFANGKAIRGGVPICFPWFGPDTEARAAGKPGPAHGFARTQPWQFSNASLIPNAAEPDAPTLHLQLTLTPTDVSRALGYPAFAAICDFTFGLDRGLTLIQRLTVFNPGPAPMHFEEALHAYFAVPDVRTTTLSGLESAPYLDKTDNAALKTAPATPLQLTETTDRVFQHNSATLSMQNSASSHKLTINKTASNTTVVWNPWEKVAATMSDLPPDSWPQFICVETANTAASTVTLAPNTANAMTQTLTLSKVI